MLCRKPSAEISRDLRAWYATSPGQYLLDSLQAQLDRTVPELFGYYALQVGNIAPPRDLLAASRIRHRVLMDCEAEFGDVGGMADALPFETDSLDLVFLAHALEFAQHPHQILREVDRTLVAEGHVVILGFNPLSLFGVWKLAAGWRHALPWCGRFYTTVRIRDWLSLLGFETLDCGYAAFWPPFQRAGLIRRLVKLEGLGSRWFPYLGGAYVILARKRVATLTPIKPRWRPRRSVLAGNLTEPTTRSIERV